MNKAIKAFKLILIFLVSGCAMVPKGYSPISQSKDELIYQRFDNFDNRTVYRHKNFFKGFNDSHGKLLSPLELYIIESYGFKFLRAKFQYSGSRWIFFSKATIVNSSGQRMEFNFNTWDKSTTVVAGNLVQERIDELLTEDLVIELHELLNNNAGDISIRLSGEYRNDYTLSEKHIIGLKSILNMYLERK